MINTQALPAILHRIYTSVLPRNLYLQILLTKKEKGMSVLPNRFFKATVYSIICILLLLPSIAGAANYTKVVAFGDSLSDHSGLQRYIGAYDPVSNPNGALTTWSNGDIWLDYLKTKINVDIDNRAIAGAMTEGHENSTIQSMINSGALPDLGFNGQIDSYVATNPIFDSATTLFALWIGGNDLLEFSRGESKYASPDALIYGATAVITQSMENLYAKGARNFLVLNLPDIGMAPAFVHSSSEIKASATLMSSMFNQMLWGRIDQFTAAHSDAKVVKFDIFSYINSQLASGIFPNPTGTYMIYDAEGNRTTSHNEPASDYFFWDMIHPTTKAHELLAGEVATKIKPVEPPVVDPGNPTTSSGSSSSCFIKSVADTTSFNHEYILIFAGIGFALFFMSGRKKD